MNNTNIFVRMDIITFVSIYLLSIKMNWILLIQVQEIRSIFGSDFTLMSGFRNLAILAMTFGPMTCFL